MTETYQTVSLRYFSFFIDFEENMWFSVSSHGELKSAVHKAIFSNIYGKRILRESSESSGSKHRMHSVFITEVSSEFVGIAYIFTIA